MTPVTNAEISLALRIAASAVMANDTRAALAMVKLIANALITAETTVDATVNVNSAEVGHA